MAIDFGALLTDDQKRGILEQRINQFSQEAYQHTLNLQVAQATNNTDGVQQTTEALDVLGTAIQVHQDALAQLPPSA